jgi:drug/metabolite transporter (DMT)-like permease
VAIAVACALGSAFMYASASVLEQRSAAAQPLERSLRLSLLIALIRKPLWLAGLGCDVIGFGLQSVALGHGALVIVQPLLVCNILFALPMGAQLAGRRLRYWDWIAAVLVCSGLAVFLTIANPTEGHQDAAAGVWTLLLVSAAGFALVLVTLSRGKPSWQRSVLLSGAAGASYAVTAALTKTCFHLLNRGLPFLLAHWQPWVLLLSGVGGMVVAQSAFQAGSLDTSLPTMSVTDPVISIVIGGLAFGESISVGPSDVALEVLALMAMSIGVFMLARSEAVRTLHQPA